jgi:hypothetical protein
MSSTLLALPFTSCVRRALVPNCISFRPLVVIAAALSCVACFATAPCLAADASSAEQTLAKVTSLVFERQPFDKAVEILAEDIGATIKFDGPSLMIEGVTRNQPISMLSQENMPAKEILKAILAKANPDGKLCYAIVMKDGNETIFITTKEGAKNNKWKLPPDFAKTEPKQPAKKNSKKR